MEKPPSYCSCSIISSGNKTKFSAVDVRLSSSETFKSYQDNDDSGSDVFPKDSFLWKINDQQEINSNFINLTLSLEKETPESLWIEIEGSNMNISCSPIIVNGTGIPQPQKPNTAGPEIKIIVGTAIGGFFVLVALIFLIVFLITRRRTQHRNLTKSAPSASFSEIKEAIYAEPQTPEAEKKTLLVSSNYMELEKNIYAEPGPANNNFKSNALPSPPYKDEESENLVPNNIYNHLGEQPAPSQIHIYDTTGNHEYSSTSDRKNKPKIINNIYDR
ncbi:hypothetical protein Bpfe_025030 [Biomphalaria pfeifferi]|uniref:Uncharacterized protein n=1 Tax=Biomphalaria pfeifferi TaxID=112525 RepID=A0AAD8F0H6_BIOPF|nr:hypothetical protein Bpfe_025030 [Biomphalaria pfeifferi]